MKNISNFNYRMPLSSQGHRTIGFACGVYTASVLQQTVLALFQRNFVY